MHTVPSLHPEPDVTDAFVGEQLSTWRKRAGAHLRLHFSDHQFLRVLFQNEHEVGGGLWRSNQPSPAQLARLAKRGFKTILNLRGVSPASFHILEREACERLGMALVSYRVASRDVPSEEFPARTKELFENIEYPALMHCKSGADRAGFLGVLYKHFRLGEPIDAAMEQLSGKYLHVKEGPTGVLDAYFETYLRDGAARGLSLIEWSETVYDRAALKASFKPDPVGRILVDMVLRRE